MLAGAAAPGRRSLPAVLSVCTLFVFGCAESIKDEGSELSASVHGCNEGSPVLLPGLMLEREPDYLAEYVTGKLISDMGQRCSAPQQRDCELALSTAEEAAATTAMRTLITIDEGQVRFWRNTSVLTLLGSIDTPEEALLYVAAVGYIPRCDSTVVSMHDRFRIHSLSITNSPCALAISPSDGLDVFADGSFGARGMRSVSPPSCIEPSPPPR